MVNHALYFGITDLVHERANRLRGVTATTQTANGRHTRVVPSGNKTFFDELQHLTLGHDGIGDIEAVELTLFRTIVRSVRTQTAEILTTELINEIVVQRTMYLKLQRTDRVRYAFEIVALTMREVVHGVHFPFGARTVVRVTRDDSIHDRITEVHVGVGHVDLGTENHLAFLYLAALHSLKET